MEYTWKVTGVKTRIEEGFEGVVFQTFWQKVGTDADGNEGTFSGATPLQFTPSENFTPFDQLTEEQILSWIQPLVTGEYEKHVNAQIQKQINIKKADVQEPPLPWNPVPPVPTPPTETN